MATAKVELQTRHRKIGAYKVTSELGRGGMALVLRAEHEHLGRPVAIKELLERGRDKEAEARFFREAQALAQFHHENIVTLYDLVEKNDSFFMVMELVDGPTLDQVIRTGPLPGEVAAVIVARLASALDHAHFHGVIHRDLKPQNVMLTKMGEVKLMDFGIAKDDKLSTLTQEGVAIGTPQYMSPEQVTGQPIDMRTDLFTLGVVLYEAISGERPFNGANAGEVFSKIRSGKYPPLLKVAPHAPTPLVRLVRKALRPKMADRFQDAASFRRELDDYLTSAVRVSHAALLASFLKKRGFVDGDESLARFTAREIETSKPLLEPQRRGTRIWPWLLAAAASGGSVLYLAKDLWRPYLAGLGF